MSCGAGLLFYDGCEYIMEDERWERMEGEKRKEDDP